MDTYNETIFDIKGEVKDIDILNESYTIALIGYDEIEGVKHADSINVAYVNPQTNEIKLLNIPRDAYTSYFCIDGSKDKITNAMAFGGGGEYGSVYSSVKCVIDGIENIIDRDIDFYISSNFDGIVNVVDTIGGIKTNVPDYLAGETWCEEASDRMTQICFDKFGEQTVDGQQALALARSRKYSSDLIRGEMQSQVIKDTLGALIAVRDTKLIQDVLYSASEDVSSNITAKQATQIAYTLYMSNRDNHVVERIQLAGTAEYGVGENSGWGSYFFIDEDSRQQTVNDLAGFMEKTASKPFWISQFEKYFLQ